MKKIFFQIVVLSVFAIMLSSCGNGSGVGVDLNNAENKTGSKTNSSIGGLPNGQSGGSTVKGRFCTMETDYNTYVHLESKLFVGGYVVVDVKRRGDAATAVATFEGVSQSEFVSVCSAWKEQLSYLMKLDSYATCNLETKTMKAKGEYTGSKSPQAAFADAAEETEEYCRSLNY